MFHLAPLKINTKMERKSNLALSSAWFCWVFFFLTFQFARLGPIYKLYIKHDILHNGAMKQSPGKIMPSLFQILLMFTQ